jgi:hypothetical protein
MSDYIICRCKERFQETYMGIGALLLVEKPIYRLASGYHIELEGRDPVKVWSVINLSLTVASPSQLEESRSQRQDKKKHGS